ncbi:MAG: hypothetical protein IT384_05320 [Deltaproteobacteria bacterium]|nr:hypothetical protein [Deltaproteobacteria bacterium]
MKKSFLIAVSVTLGSAGCSAGQECVDSFSQIGDAFTPCVETIDPNTGEPACYNKAQACFSLFPINFRTVLSGMTPEGEQRKYTVNVIIANQGEAPLTVSGIRSRGDDRCAFVNGKYSPALGAAIEGGKSLVFKFDYRPTGAGTDHAAIEVKSDAENSPTTLIPVCGRAVTSTVGQDPALPMSCEDRATAEYTDCLEMM